MVIRSKYRYNNYQKIKTLNRIYKILDILRKRRSTSTGKLIELTTKFYAFILADYKSIADFSSQLSQINNKLQDLHSSIIFMPV
jgi:hypothetical protein